MYNASEDPSPLAGMTPPDRQPQPLGYHVQCILEIVGADRMITPDEEAQLGALIQGLKIIAEGKVNPQGAAPGAMPEEEGAPAPSGETSEYGSGYGEEKYPQGQWRR